MFGRVSTTGAKRKGRVVEDDDDEDEDEIEDTNSKRNKTSDQDELEDSDDDLADDPLTAKPRKPPAPKAPAKRKPGRPAGRKEASPVAISDDEGDPPPDTSLEEYLKAPVPSQSSDIPSIPRALLLRLMHEHFASKETRIDKHALVVLEKYFEIYIREAMARSLLAKKEDVEKGAASQSEERWLEKSDLEKIVAGVVMDF
jgi:histone H3/H4